MTVIDEYEKDRDIALASFEVSSNRVDWVRSRLSETRATLLLEEKLAEDEEET